MNKADLIEKQNQRYAKLKDMFEVADEHDKDLISEGLVYIKGFLTDLKELEEGKSKYEIEKLAQEYAGNYVCPLNNGKAVTPYEHGAIQAIKIHFKAGVSISK